MASATQTARGQITPRFPFHAILWYAGLLALAFAPVLMALFDQYQSDEEMSHGPFIPLVAGYIAWERRAEWLGAPARRSVSGLFLVAAGTLLLWAGTLGAEIFLQRAAVLLSLAGVILYYGGAPAIRTLAFPLLLLLFMIPLPGVLYKQITFPLQLLATGLADSILGAFGYIVIRDGNVLELAGQRISVVEACSGLRSLHTLAFFSLAYAYLFDSRAWMRGFLLAATAPVAIFANAMRVALTGAIGEHNPELAQGVYHTISGWSLFVISVCLLVVLQKAAGRIFRRVG